MVRLQNGTNKGLGRLRAPDARDKRYQLADIVPRQSARTARYWWANGWWGDQGYYPHCVGYAWTHWIEDGPVTHKGPAPAVDPVNVYTLAQLNDEWPGQDYDGTSVRAGVKVLQALGYISAYRWAWDIDTLIMTLLTTGPVVAGTDWYEGMMHPGARNGRIHAIGDLLGGHAYLINGVNTKSKLFRIKNSWGRTWGANGHAFIPFRDMEKLIAREGEICLAIETQKNV